MRIFNEFTLTIALVLRLLFLLKEIDDPITLTCEACMHTSHVGLSCKRHPIFGTLLDPAKHFANVENRPTRTNANRNARNAVVREESDIENASGNEENHLSALK